ncbi:hypothetical protein D9M71_330300 [compost metagenome]
MQRAQQNLGARPQGVLKALVNPANLGLPRQEHQHAAGLVSQRMQHAVHHPWLDELAWLERPPPADIHRMHAPFAADHRGVVQQPRQALTFQRRRHQQNLQGRVVTQQLAAVKAQRKCEIGIQAAFVIFVENQQAHPFQRRVGLQAACEDAFGHHFNTGFRADLAVQTDAVTHRFPNLLAQLTGQPFGRCPRSQAPWLEHEDALPGQPRFVQQRQWHAGGLASARRRFKHHFVTVFQSLAQGGQGSING